MSDETTPDVLQTHVPIPVGAEQLKSSPQTTWRYCMEGLALLDGTRIFLHSLKINSRRLISVAGVYPNNHYGIADFIERQVQANNPAAPKSPEKCST